MKKILFIFCLISIGFSFGQEKPIEITPSFKYFGDVKVGTGFTPTGAVLVNLTGGLGVILTNNLYFRAGYDLGFGGRIIHSNSTVSYSGYNFKMGYSFEQSESFRVVPFFGVGYNDYKRTTYRHNEELNAANNLAADIKDNIPVGDKDKKKKEVKNRYLTEDVSGLSVPVGVNFHMHKKNVGFVIGGYINISKYQEFGVRLGLDFGKLK